MAREPLPNELWTISMAMAFVSALALPSAWYELPLTSTIALSTAFGFAFGLIWVLTEFIAKRLTYRGG